MPPSLFGYCVKTELPLGRLVEGPGDRGRLEVSQANGELLDRPGELVAWHPGVEPETSVALARTDTGVLLWCERTGAYLVDGREGAVWTDASRGLTPRWEHRLVSTAIPLLLSERGDLLLHAASVRTAAGAILFCGPSRRGKSTIAAALALQGHPVLDEDGACLGWQDGRLVTWPGAPGARLNDTTFHALTGEPASESLADGGKQTRSLGPQRHGGGPLPVAAVVVLSERGGSEVELSSVRAREAISALVPNAMYGGPSKLSHTFSLVARAVGEVPVYRGRLPDRLAAAHENARILLDRARSALPGQAAISSASRPEPSAATRSSNPPTT